MALPKPFSPVDATAQTEAAAQPPAPPAIKRPAQSGDTFVPAMRVTAVGGLTPSIHGFTNLPEGSQLIVALINHGIDYFAQAEVTVHNGTFATESFSNSNLRLPSTSYNVDISMSLAQFQPQQVQDVIGSHGERMLGNYVVQAPEAFSTEGEERMFHYATMISVTAD